VRFLAYLDANSGSMIAAAVAGGLAGVAVVVKLWWRRVMGVFSPRRRAALRAERAARAEDASKAVDATDVASPAAQAPAEK
jgi:hypothetical protein